MIQELARAKECNKCFCMYDPSINEKCPVCSYKSYSNRKKRAEGKFGKK